MKETLMMKATLSHKILFQSNVVQYVVKITELYFWQAV